MKYKQGFRNYALFFGELYAKNPELCELRNNLKQKF